MVADPATVREGDELTVEGTGLPPSSEITITYVDADGATVATQRVGTDEAGGFTDVLVVPAGTALGELVVTATASGVSATTSVEVAESGEGDPDGGDPTGDDAEGADTAGGGDTDGGDGGDADGGDAAGDGTDGADDDGDSDGADADGRPGDVEAALLADPATVRVGEAATVTGTDFPPTAEVTVTYVDASGDTVATHVVTSDETGAFSDVRSCLQGRRWVSSWSPRLPVAPPRRPRSRSSRPLVVTTMTSTAARPMPTPPTVMTRRVVTPMAATRLVVVPMVVTRLAMTPTVTTRWLVTPMAVTRPVVTPTVVTQLMVSPMAATSRVQTAAVRTPTARTPTASPLISSRSWQPIRPSSASATS